jgi:hypothetical protein
VVDFFVIGRHPNPPGFVQTDGAKKKKKKARQKKKRVTPAKRQEPFFLIGPRKKKKYCSLKFFHLFKFQAGSSKNDYQAKSCDNASPDP